MYNLCQAYLNGSIDESTFLTFYENFLDISIKLIEIELEVTNDNISSPPTSEPPKLVPNNNQTNL